jgi:hypothetical protein
MAAPTRDDALDVTFLVSGIDRDCGCPRYQDQLHEKDLVLLPQTAGVEDAQGRDSWRKRAYTAMLVMDSGSTPG